MQSPSIRNEVESGREAPGDAGSERLENPRARFEIAGFSVDHSNSGQSFKHDKVVHGQGNREPVPGEDSGRFQIGQLEKGVFQEMKFC
jgi:hypothetical protein